jgi:membrane protein CcdC involved in cytochrome C biogenesis
MDQMSVYTLDTVFNSLVTVLVPICVCVILPVTIVWIVMKAKKNEVNRKSEILLKAIESGVAIDTNLFKTEQRHISTKERLLKRLTGACVTTFIGIAIIISSCITWSRYGNSIHADNIQFPLLAGCTLLAVGIALFIVFFTGKKMLAKEIEAEEQGLEQK